jgi:hypothetical protein
MTGTSRLISCLVAANLWLPVPVWVLLQPNLGHATDPILRVSVLGHGQLFLQSLVSARTGFRWLADRLTLGGFSS